MAIIAINANHHRHHHHYYHRHGHHNHRRPFFHSGTGTGLPQTKNNARDLRQKEGIMSITWAWFCCLERLSKIAKIAWLGARSVQRREAETRRGEPMMLIDS